MKCIFCEMVSERIVLENNLAYVIRDGYPVTGFHSLIIPKRHAETFFDLTADELLSINQLLTLTKNEIQRLDPTVEGFNIGANVGEVAGQTVFHCHVHLIPRRKGDVSNPRGGVRHIIPDKGYY